MKLTLLTILTCTLLMVACTKDKLKNSDTLHQLYKIYQEGEINECLYNGETVYEAGINAYDAGSVVYDKDGNKIGDCNYAWGNVDPICAELKNCQTIYRCKKHITGNPAIDKYGLGR